MVSENIFVNASGTTIGVGSKTFTQTILYGISGGVAIPVAVNGSGQLMTV